MKVTKANVETIYDKASDAAIQATNEHLREHGDADCCGFAWVVIRPARGTMVSYLKKIGVGRSNYGGGWRIYNPSENLTQALTAKEVGASAFAKVLREYGVSAYPESRMD